MVLFLPVFLSLPFSSWRGNSGTRDLGPNMQYDVSILFDQSNHSIMVVVRSEG